MHTIFLLGIWFYPPTDIKNKKEEVEEEQERNLFPDMKIMKY